MAEGTSIASMLPGTRVAARGLSWEVVNVEPAGEQQRFRLRCLDGALRGDEVDFLSPFETITPIASELDPRRAARLGDWRLYHQAFLLEHEGVITSSVAQYVTDMDAAGVRPYLKRIVEEGHAVQEGQRRGTRYRSIKSG